MSLPELTYACLEDTFNRYLALDPVARERVAQLHGRVFALELRGTDTTLFLIPGPGGTQLLTAWDETPDCTLCGTPLALTKLFRDGSVSEEVELTGDDELARRLLTILQEMEIDWERSLTPYTGEIIAQELVKVGRAAVDWGRHIHTTLDRELREILQGELGLLPTRPEIDQFTRQVTDLETKSMALEQRIRGLAVKGGPK